MRRYRTSHAVRKRGKGRRTSSRLQGLQWRQVTGERGECDSFSHEPAARSTKWRSSSKRLCALSLLSPSFPLLPTSSPPSTPLSPLTAIPRRCVYLSLLLFFPSFDTDFPPSVSCVLSTHPFALLLLSLLPVTIHLTSPSTSSAHSTPSHPTLTYHLNHAPSCHGCFRLCRLCPPSRTNRPWSHRPRPRPQRGPGGEARID
jgi:hypothetical protein